VNHLAATKNGGTYISLTDVAPMISVAIVSCSQSPESTKGGKKPGGSCSLDWMQAVLSISSEEHGEFPHVLALGVSIAN
jgi:hypothetical protein